MIAAAKRLARMVKGRSVIRNPLRARTLTIGRSTAEEAIHQDDGSERQLLQIAGNQLRGRHSCPVP
jgi:hypothetical protein